MIVLDRHNALIDRAIAIRVERFPRRRPVTITATQTFYDASRWQAHATFISDDGGCVDVGHQAPVSGRYDGVSPMGLVWAAQRLPGKAQPVPMGSITRPLPVDIEAAGPDGSRAQATLERHVAEPGVTRHPIRTEGIVGTLFLPRALVRIQSYSWSAGAVGSTSSAALRVRGARARAFRGRRFAARPRQHPSRVF